jgi:FkbM family methyltransferase
VITRGISIYKQEGAKALSQRALQKILRETYCKSMSVRGRYSLTLDDLTLTFSAPTATMVHRNRGRFKSERQELRDLINEIQEGDVVYDIGANTGLYTLFAAMACPNGEVIAFEPYLPNLNLLKQDVSRNKLQNVDIRGVALSNSTGNISFSQPEKDNVGYGSSSIETDQPEATIEVPTTTGDQLVADDEIPAPNVVKIDVEGAESLVLKGLENALSGQSCRTVYCEVHLPGVEKRPSVEDFGSSPEAIQKYLENFGFTIEQVHNRDSEIFYKARK